MKYTFETEINAPREKVAELAGNPANRLQWMEGLKSDEQVSGTPGQLAAKSRLVFQTGKVEIIMNGTVTARNLPDDFSETMDASNVFIAITSRFVALSPHRTRYISEQDYHFKGVLNKIVGFLLQGEFKKQALTHVENFKRFAEQS